MSKSLKPDSMAEKSLDGQGMVAYRGPSLFQPHQARQALRDAHEGRIRPMIGSCLMLCAISNARWMAPMGFDANWIDWEHAACDIETVTTIIHETAFMSEGKTVPFVRVPGHDHANIAYALDAGASLIVPQVDTVEQAKRIVSYAKFGGAVNGQRSIPPFRLFPGITDTAIDGTKTLHGNLNEQAAIIIQSESLEGINNLDAILTEVPEIDGCFLGARDCRVSMGLPMADGTGSEQKWVEAAAKWEATVKKHNKPRVALAFGQAAIEDALAMNTALIFVAADSVALAGMVGDLAKARQAASTSFRNAVEHGDPELKIRANGIV